MRWRGLGRICPEKYLFVVLVATMWWEIYRNRNNQAFRVDISSHGRFFIVRSDHSNNSYFLVSAFKTSLYPEVKESDKNIFWRQSLREIYNGIIGLAIGDALGVPVEFKSRAEIAENPVVSMREYGTHDQPLGTWSDDTRLTLALMDSMIQCRAINDVDIMDRFSAWLLEGEYTATGEVFDVGNATSRAIMNYGRGISPIKCGGASEYENGNGSLMRILPLAYYIYRYKDLDLNGKIELIHKISSFTHRHIRSCIGCDIYLFIAMEMIERNGSLVQCIQNGVCTIFDFSADVDKVR